MSFGRPSSTPEQRQQERAARIAAQRPPSVRLHRGVMAGAVQQVEPKPQTFRSERWLAAVRALDVCVRCGRHGVQAAHRNESKGMGIKAPDCACAALCPVCHTELDSGNTMTRDEKRAEMDRCIVLTVIALASAGKVKAT